MLPAAHSHLVVPESAGAAQSLSDPASKWHSPKPLRHPLRTICSTSFAYCSNMTVFDMRNFCHSLSKNPTQQSPNSAERWVFWAGLWGKMRKEWRTAHIYSGTGLSGFFKTGQKWPCFVDLYHKLQLPSFVYSKPKGIQIEAILEMWYIEFKSSSF